MLELPFHPVNEDHADAAGIERDIASCARSHASLAEHLGGLDEIDPTTPSRLPGWRIGHVLTHIARNADGHRSMLDGAAQYPHGVDGRDHDIEVGAHRSWAELVDDVVSSSAALDARWRSGGDWHGTSQLLSGPRPTSLLPFLRQREVEVHRADLGLGYEFADMPSDYVRRELRLMVMLWKARRPMGMTPLPAEALALAAPNRLAWLMGRIAVDGLAPAGLL